MQTFTFYLRPPFNFDLSVAAAAAYWAAGQAVVRDSKLTYRRAIRIGQALALVELVSDGTADTPRIEARLLAVSGTLQMSDLEREIGWMIDPAFDLAPFYAMAHDEPALHETIHQLYGLRFLRINSVFESLIVTMIEQQISLKSAQKAERWLVETYGDALDFDGERYYAFPTPERLATLSVDDLAPLKITFIRMGRIIEVARLQASGEIVLETLKHQSAETLYQALVGLRGVGHWTAAWTINRALGQFTYLGAADVALRAAVNHYVHGKTGRMNGREMDAYFARYGEFAGLAAFYIIMRWAFDKSAF
jgi:DNA-3-methyladenine glycosylase II